MKKSRARFKFKRVLFEASLKVCVLKLRVDVFIPMTQRALAECSIRQRNAQMLIISPATLKVHSRAETTTKSWVKGVGRNWARNGGDGGWSSWKQQWLLDWRKKMFLRITRKAHWTPQRNRWNSFEYENCSSLLNHPFELIHIWVKGKMNEWTY